jgi:hypothetical protein
LVLLLLLSTIVVASVTSGNVPEVFGDNIQTAATGIEKMAPAGVSPQGWDPQPVTGMQNVLMIVVDFPDHHISHDMTYFQNILTGAHNSMNEYFVEDSYGIASINGLAKGPFTLANPMAHYHVWTRDACSGSGAISYQGFAAEAIQMADPSTNYNNWQHIIILAPGIHGCRVDVFVPYIETDERNIFGGVAHVSEEEGLSVIVHEFGHDIGLPDLYDDETPGDPYGFVGGWDPMGPTYPNLPLTDPQTFYPMHHSAFSKMRLGWIPAGEVLDVNLASPSGEFTATIDVISGPITTTNGYHGLRIGIDPWHASRYFLVESRWKIGYDQYIPSYDAHYYSSVSPERGVLIFYIDRDKGGTDGIVRLQPPSPFFATDTCDQFPATKVMADGDALWRVGETYVNGGLGLDGHSFGISIKSFIGTPSGGGFQVVVTHPYALYAVNFDARTLGGALLSGAAPTVQYEIGANAYFPTPISGTGTVPFTVWAEEARTVTYTYQGTVSGPGVTYAFDHDDHGGALRPVYPSVSGYLSTRCFYPDGGTGCARQTVTGYYSSSITPPLVVVLAAVAPTTIPTGTLFTWMLSFTIIAAVDSSNVVVRGSFDPTVNVTSICVDDLCTQGDSFKFEWPTMLAGTSHIVTVTGVGSFDYPGVVGLIRDVSVVGDSPSGAIMIPMGPWSGPEVTVVGGEQEELPVGGEVYSPRATAILLPWLLLMLAAIGATTTVVWKRYSPIVVPAR